MNKEKTEPFDLARLLHQVEQTRIVEFSSVIKLVGKNVYSGIPEGNIYIIYEGPTVVYVGLGEGGAQVRIQAFIEGNHDGSKRMMIEHGLGQKERLWEFLISTCGVKVIGVEGPLSRLKRVESTLIDEFQPRYNGEVWGRSSRADPDKSSDPEQDLDHSLDRRDILSLCL